MICCRLPTMTCSTLAMICRLMPLTSIEVRGFSVTLLLSLAWERGGVLGTRRGEVKVPLEGLQIRAPNELYLFHL